MSTKIINKVQLRTIDERKEIKRAWALIQGIWKHRKINALAYQKK